MIKSCSTLTKNLTIRVTLLSSKSSQRHSLKVPIFGAIFEKIRFVGCENIQNIEQNSIDAINKLLDIYGEKIKTLYFKNFNTQLIYASNKASRWELIGNLQSQWIQKLANVTHLKIDVNYLDDIAFITKECKVFFSKISVLFIIY